MISSTLLKNLLDKKQYQEFQNVLEKHYSSEDKLDVSSSQKVTNLIAFQLANEKNFDNNVFSMLIKYFEVALVSLIQNEIIDTVILEKVLGSCYHVVSRLCKEENQDTVKLMLHFMPKVEEFCSKFKQHLENSKFQEAFPSIAFQTSSTEIYKSAINFYQNCCSNSKQENLQTGILRLVKDLSIRLEKNSKKLTEEIIDQFAIKNEVAKLHLLMLKLERKLGRFLETLQQIYDIFQNNLTPEIEKVLLPYVNKFLLIICKYGNEKKQLDIIDMAINTVNLVSKEMTPKLQIGLDKMWYVKFSIHYDMKDYEQALQDCIERVKYLKPNDAKNLVDCFVSCKRKTKSNKIIDSKDVALKKLEIRAYRPYEEFISDRYKVAKELIAIAKSEHDKNLAQLELIWIKLVKKEDVEKCIESCEKILKSAPSHCPEIMFLVHFWYAFSLWNKTRQDLHLQSKEMTNKDESTSSRDKLLEIGDLTCVYSKVLNMNLHKEIIKHLKSCYLLMAKEKEFQDEMVTSNDLEMIRNVINEIMEIVCETSDIIRIEDEFSYAWKLLENGGGQFKQVQKILEHLGNFDNDSWEGRLKSVEKTLIKAHLLSLSPDFQSTTSDTPMECGTLTFRSTGQALKFCDKIHEFEKIFLMFKCFNLASKARHFFLQTLVTIGLPKEMRMLGKMSVDIGVDMALLPALCKELLQSVEVDLFCDDSKQAQVKLREVESLLQEDLRSQPRKTKTKSSKTSEFLMPNERQELICASPNMTKGLHGLPDWLIKNSQANSLLLTIVLKYFTYQAVVWHLEGDNEAMSNYFHKVEDVINKETKDKRPLSSMLTCQKWMFECYARLDEFDLCNRVLTSMKSVLTIKPIPYWTSVFKEAAISLALAKNDRNLNFEPSPIRQGSAMYPGAQVAVTPSVVKERPSRLPQLKSKKAVPVLFDTEVKMLKLNINEEEEEEFKTPICKSSQKATRPTRSRSSSKTTRK